MTRLFSTTRDPFAVAPTALATWCAQERATFIRDGFLLRADFLTLDGVRALAAEVRAVLDGRRGAGFGLVLSPEGEPLLASRLENVSDLFWDFARDRRVLSVVEALAGTACLPLHVECFSKPAHSANQTPPHQNQIFYQDHFRDEIAITCWIALCDITPDSAPLAYAAPAPQRLLPHVGSPSGRRGCRLAGRERRPLRAMPIPRGGCLFHHQFAVHASEANHSDRARQALAFTFRGSSYLARRRDR
jgi:hypothetical protein